MTLARRALYPVLSLVLAACHEATAPDTRTIPAALAAVSATDLAGTVGAAVQPAPSVRVSNSGGEPIPNVDVHFAVTAGSGSIAGATVRTDAQGVATIASWTLGTVPGANTLTATVGTLPAVQFSATAAPGAAVALALVSGDGQSDTTRSTLSPIVVRAMDAFGNVVPKATVEATITADAGTIDPTTLTTGPDGLAQIRWTLGTTAGPQAVRLQLSGLPSTAFILHATTRWPEVLATALSAGYNHNCALLANRRLFCWGDNEFGQVGDDSKVDRPIAVPVGDGIAWAQVAAGAAQTCGLTTAGQTLCWGTNRWGQLGDGTLTDHITPAPITGAPAFVQLVRGAEYNCGRTAAGEVYCWGFMVGTTWDVPHVPTLVSGTSHFRTIAGGDYQLCGVDDAGVTQCFVGQYTGRVTSGGIAVSEWRPRAVVGAPSLVALSGGLDFMCGLTDVGAAYCWGGNRFGQLGNGSYDSTAVPIAVAGAHPFRSIHTGYDFACGITLGGEAYCWGHNSWGTLGVDSQPFTFATPVLLAAPSGKTYTAMTGGFYHFCAVASTSQALCWGGGFDGQLGDGVSRTTDEFHHRAAPGSALRH